MIPYHQFNRVDNIERSLRGDVPEREAPDTVEILSIVLALVLSLGCLGWILYTIQPEDYTDSGVGCVNDCLNVK